MLLCVLPIVHASCVDLKYKIHLFIRLSLSLSSVLTAIFQVNLG